jgi:hypothetical protein
MGFNRESFPHQQLGELENPIDCDRDNSHRDYSCHITVSLLTTGLFWVIRQTIGRLTTALVKDVSTVALPASDALILPCIAIVAAAAVVLALLTSPPKMPVTSIP